MLPCASVARTSTLAIGALLALACSDNPTAADGTGGGQSSGGSMNSSGGSMNSSGGSMNSSGGSMNSSAGSMNSSAGTGSAGLSGGAGSSAVAGAPAGGANNAMGGTTSGGAGAMAGTAGASLAGSGGSGGVGKPDVKKSAGCGMSTSQKAEAFVESKVMTGGADRPYSVRLPAGYDPMRAYPVIVLLHGCGSGTNNVAMEKSTGADAILIRGTGSASGTCWDTAANGPDVAFFDAMVADVKARFCSDEHRFFAVGYSSGSWLANQLTCIRADVLRGAGSVTGGESSNGKCGGPVARIFIHDQGDTTNVISGSEKARDRQLTQNSCDKTKTPTAVDPSPCKLYQGCTAGYPVEWCQTTGQQHNRQDSLAGPAFWNFFKAL